MILIITVFLNYLVSQEAVLLPYSGPRIITTVGKKGIIFSASQAGGCWISKDFGRTWEKFQIKTWGIGDAWGTSKGFLFYQFEFAYHQVQLWKCDIEKGEHKLVFLDRGVASGGKITYFTESPDGVLYFIIGGKNNNLARVYKSVDDGETWERVLTVPDCWRKERRVIAAHRGGFVAVALSYQVTKNKHIGEMYISYNYGKRWYIIKNMPPHPRGLEMLSKDEMAYVTWNGEVFIIKNIRKPKKLYALKICDQFAYGPCSIWQNASTRSMWELGISKYGNIYITSNKTLLVILEKGKYVLPLFMRLWDTDSIKQKPFVSDRENGYIYVGHGGVVVTSISGALASGGKLIRIKDAPSDEYDKPKFKSYAFVRYISFKDTMTVCDTSKGIVKAIADITGYKKHILTIQNEHDVPIVSELFVVDEIGSSEVNFHRKLIVEAKKSENFHFEAKGYAYLKLRALKVPGKRGWTHAFLYSFSPD